jgi:prepilin-type N-terminal cleavage/methylation domain-containing protein
MSLTLLSWINVKNKGYTLLEVVVVIGILSVLVGAGVATLVPFKERREVLSNTRNMAALLKQVQVKSSAVEIPGDCDATGVGDFELEFAGGSVNLLVKTPGGVTCKLFEDVLVFSGGTEFVLADSIVFKTPFGSASPVVISICDYGIQYDLEIGENGNVSEPKKSAIPGCI